jgi:hypothetical protein
MTGIGLELVVPEDWLETQPAAEMQTRAHAASVKNFL